MSRSKRWEMFEGADFKIMWSMNEFIRSGSLEQWQQQRKPMNGVLDCRQAGTLPSLSLHFVWHCDHRIKSTLGQSNFDAEFAWQPLPYPFFRILRKAWPSIIWPFPSGKRNRNSLWDTWDMVWVYHLLHQLTKEATLWRNSFISTCVGFKVFKNGSVCGNFKPKAQTHLKRGSESRNRW